MAADLKANICAGRFGSETKGCDGLGARDLFSQSTEIRYTSREGIPTLSALEENLPQVLAFMI